MHLHCKVVLGDMSGSGSVDDIFTAGKNVFDNFDINNPRLFTTMS